MQEYSSTVVPMIKQYTENFKQNHQNIKKNAVRSIPYIMLIYLVADLQEWSMPLVRPDA